jgi:hypothetical protein
LPVKALQRDRNPSVNGSQSTGSLNGPAKLGGATGSHRRGKVTGSSPPGQLRKRWKIGGSATPCIIAQSGGRSTRREVGRRGLPGSRTRAPSHDRQPLPSLPPSCFPTFRTNRPPFPTPTTLAGLPGQPEHLSTAHTTQVSPFSHFRSTRKDGQIKKRDLGNPSEAASETRPKGFAGFPTSPPRAGRPITTHSR